MLIRRVAFKKSIYFIFSVVLGLHCCTRAFSSCREQGYSLGGVPGLLTVVVSPVVEHRL